MATEVVKHVVVDAGGFIRNAPIREIGENVYTIPEVVSESCDKATRKRLQVLPYTIHFKQPSAEAVLFVSDFAKKTGDYRHLSVTDIRVLALTYMLEKEHVGVDHIKQQPDVKPAQYIVPNKAAERTDIAGFYLGKNRKSIHKQDKGENENSEPADKEGLGKGEEVEPENDSGDLETGNDNGDLETENDSGVLETENGRGDLETENGDQEAEKDNDPREWISTESKRSKDSLAAFEETDAISDIHPNDFLVESVEVDEEEEEYDDDDDDEGWITPSNIKNVMRQMDGGYEETENKQVAVACLTTDFAMQNVLIHMGLNVVSVDGMLIKRASSYILRCTACFKITYQMDKVFCNHCGNKTLKRVAMTREEDGSIRYFFSNRPLNLKGKKFPIPMPKGGKHSNNPVLFEDQPLPQQRMPRKAQEKVDIFSPDFVEGSSPFALNDVTSRAAKIGISGKHDFRRGAYWNKRNPNEPRKYYGKKKGK